MGQEWLGGTPRPERPTGYVPVHVYTVPIDGALLGFALQEKPWGIATHYVEESKGKKRSIICEGTSCPCASERWVNKRWIGYLPVRGATTGVLGIVAVTVKADQALEAIRRANGSIMNVRLKFYREPRPKHSRRRNDEVKVEADGPGLGPGLRGSTFDVRPTVLLMYGYDNDSINRLLGGG